MTTELNRGLGFEKYFRKISDTGPSGEYLSRVENGHLVGLRHSGHVKLRPFNNNFYTLLMFKQNLGHVYKDSTGDLLRSLTS